MRRLAQLISQLKADPSISHRVDCLISKCNCLAIGVRADIVTFGRKLKENVQTVDALANLDTSGVKVGLAYTPLCICRVGTALSVARGPALAPGAPRCSETGPGDRATWHY